MANMYMKNWSTVSVVTTWLDVHSSKSFDSFSNRCRRIQLRKSSDSSSTSARRLCADTSLVFSAYDEYEVSPYEELKLTLVRNIEMSRMASIMAGRFSFQRASRHVHLSSLNS